MKDSHISWTHHTFNPWVGCDKIAPECAHCYIDREIRKQKDWQSSQVDWKKSHLLPPRPPRKPWGEVYLTKTWEAPYNWQLELQIMKSDKLVYSRVFTCSLSDFFHAKVDDRTIAWNGVPGRRGLGMHTSPADRAKSDRWRDCAWQVIRDTPNLVYLILTKRPELIEARLPKDWGQGYKNVWLGTSVGCKLTLSKMDSLRKIPVHPEAVRFVSCEPLLEDISQAINLDGYGWVICGGESGSNPEYLWNPAGDWRTEFAQPGRRTMQVPWAYNLMLAAKRNLLPFWFKQITASRSGQGEDALGFVMQEVPDPPKDGIWIPEQSDFPITRPKPETAPLVIDHDYIDRYFARFPQTRGNLIGQYRAFYGEAEPPFSVGTYYTYEGDGGGWHVCRLGGTNKRWKEEIISSHMNKEDAVSMLDGVWRKNQGGK